MGLAPLVSVLVQSQAGPPGSAAKVELELIVEGTSPAGQPRFRSVSRIATSRSGAVYFVDDTGGQIHWIDPRGTFRGSIGREGTGPGEYRNIIGMAVHGDSLLIVHDPGNARLSVFDTAGVFRTAIPFTRGSYYGGQTLLVDRLGMIYLRVGLGAGMAEGRNTPSQYLRLTLAGALVDSIRAPDEDLAGWPFVVITEDGPQWSFPVITLFSVLPDGGMAWGRNSAYHIDLHRANGQRHVIDRPYSGVPIRDTEREEWDSLWRSIRARSSERQPTPIPALKPAFRDLFADHDGRLWVHLYVPARSLPPVPTRPQGRSPPLTIREPNVYDVFGQEAGFLARIELLENAHVIGAGGDRIWALASGPAGEPTFHRYRIVWK